MSTESNLWTWLRRARDVFGPALHIRRVENAISTGDPDVEGQLLGEGQFNIELKVAKRPKRELTRLRFGHEVTQAQVEWADDRLEAGGACAFLIAVGGPFDGGRAIYLLHGIYAEELVGGVTEQWLKEHALQCNRPEEVVRLAPHQTKVNP